MGGSRIVPRTSAQATLSPPMTSSPESSPRSSSVVKATQRRTGKNPRHTTAPSTRTTRSQVPRIALEKALPTLSSKPSSARVTKQKRSTATLAIRTKRQNQPPALPALTEREHCILNTFFTEVLRRRREAIVSSLASPPPSSPVAPSSTGTKFKFIWTPSFGSNPVPSAVPNSDGQEEQFEHTRTCFRHWKAALGVGKVGDIEKIEDELVKMLREALGTQIEVLDVGIDNEAIRATEILMRVCGAAVEMPMEKEDLEAVKVLMLLKRADARLAVGHSVNVRETVAKHEFFKSLNTCVTGQNGVQHSDNDTEMDDGF